MDRRTTLGLLASLLGTSGLGGCLGGSGKQSGAETPTPIALDGSKTDDQGGMIIGNHGGPNGQIFYANNSPEGHDNPAWFHTLTAGLFPYYFEHERVGWTATAIYVTDYSVVDYEVTSVRDKQQISSHTGADTFGDATAMTYVMGSDVIGGMGPALIPFSETGEAEEFITEYGGRTLAFDEITMKLINDYMRG